MDLKQVELTPELVIGLIVQKKDGENTISGKVIEAGWAANPDINVEGKPLLIGLVEYEDGSYSTARLNQPGFYCWKGVLRRKSEHLSYPGRLLSRRKWDRQEIRGFLLLYRRRVRGRSL